MSKMIQIVCKLGLIALLLAPTESWAFPEDSCTNNAVPRTTPSSDFTVMGNGSVVRHETTGLEWQRCAVGQTWDGSTCTGSASSRTWQGALDVAAAAGDGWRLPNVNELRSIVEECRIIPAINRVVFPNSPSSYFWSASPYAGYSGSAWGVHFSSGSDSRSSKSNNNRVRLVRGGQ